MLKIENLETYGWQAAIRGLRNPKNSWAKSDSVFERDNDSLYFELGEADLELCKRMNGASCESKYRRMITVTMDITAPLYWWKEFDTYKVGTVANSCSTMHKIHAKEFELGDFSCEHLANNGYIDLKDGNKNYIPLENLKETIKLLNICRNMYNETKDKEYWWQMIQLLPSSYNQKRTVQLNYEVLSQMYKWRRTHKLDEWRIFCEIIEKLPYSGLII